MSSAFTGCGDSACPVCSVNSRFAVKPEPCGKPVDKGHCGLVAGHDRRVQCRAGREGRKESADLKESEPVVPITNEQAVVALAYKRRKREGAVRQQRA